MNKRPIACLIYDFDKTLSPANMQEYGFLPDLNISPDDFWAECTQYTRLHHMDSVLSYMHKMLEKAEGIMPITRESLSELGQGVDFFPGVESWFERINRYGDSLGMDVEHYIISSGLKEIIEGSRIAHEFKAIFAASFCYGEDGHALWPATAVNYTNKTQHLFRINKGILDISNDVDLNRFMPEHRRPIPFRNMIYIGDGLTDVPCMKMTRLKGGMSIAVHAPGDSQIADEMILQNRTDFAITADYTEGSEMEQTVQMIFRRIAAVDECARLRSRHIDIARSRIVIPQELTSTLIDSYLPISPRPDEPEF